jgi:hypothetical protein
LNEPQLGSWQDVHRSIKAANLAIAARLQAASFKQSKQQAVELEKYDFFVFEDKSVSEARRAERTREPLRFAVA